MERLRSVYKTIPVCSKRKSIFFKGVGGLNLHFQNIFLTFLFSLLLRYNVISHYLLADVYTSNVFLYYESDKAKTNIFYRDYLNFSVC